MQPVSTTTVPDSQVPPPPQSKPNRPRPGYHRTLTGRTELRSQPGSTDRVFRKQGSKAPRALHLLTAAGIVIPKGWNKILTARGWWQHYSIPGTTKARRT